MGLLKLTLPPFYICQLPLNITVNSDIKAYEDTSFLEVLILSKTLFRLFFERGSHYVAQTGLELSSSPDWS
jgi:hypothetical protein